MSGYEKINFRNGKELQALCDSRALPISEIMLLRECSLSENPADPSSPDGARMGDHESSAHSPIDSPKKSMGGLIGGEAQALFLHRAKGKNCLRRSYEPKHHLRHGRTGSNASMGLIVAAPTAGSSGIVPGVLLALQEEYDLADEPMVRVLFNAGAIGYLAMRNATVAGAVAAVRLKSALPPPWQPPPL